MKSLYLLLLLVFSILSFNSFANDDLEEELNFSCLTDGGEMTEILESEKIFKRTEIHISNCQIFMNGSQIKVSAGGNFIVFAEKRVLVKTEGELQGNFKTSVLLDPQCNVTGIDLTTSDKKFSGVLGWLAKQWYYVLNGDKVLDKKFKKIIRDKIEKLKLTDPIIGEFCP